MNLQLCYLLTVHCICHARQVNRYRKWLALRYTNWKKVSVCNETLKFPLHFARVNRLSHLQYRQYSASKPFIYLTVCVWERRFLGGNLYSFWSILRLNCMVLPASSCHLWLGSSTTLQLGKHTSHLCLLCDSILLFFKCHREAHNFKTHM